MTNILNTKELPNAYIITDSPESLGLKKINSCAIHNDTPAIRGMIHVVRHLVSVEEINE